MTTPARSQLTFYTNEDLTDTDWETNWLQLISYLTAGTYDFTINDLACNGAITATGNITSSGTITGSSFVGDGSGLTNISLQFKNWIINGDNAGNTVTTGYTLLKDQYGEASTFQFGMATGTLVTAGTFNTVGNASVGTTGRATKFTSTTITGTGVLFHRIRLRSADSANFINQFASVSCKVYHDVGSAINYTIYVRKADATDNFTSVTEIANDGGTSVESATPTTLEFENVSMGDPSNGIEIELKIECGAITTKNFENTEFQLEINPEATTFESRITSEEFANVIFDRHMTAIDDLVRTNAGYDIGVQTGDQVILDGDAGGVSIMSPATDQIELRCAGSSFLSLDQPSGLLIPYGTIRPSTDDDSGFKLGNSSFHWYGLWYGTGALNPKACFRTNKKNIVYFEPDYETLPDFGEFEWKHHNNGKRVKDFVINDIKTNKNKYKYVNDDGESMNLHAIIAQMSKCIKDLNERIKILEEA